MSHNIHHAIYDEKVNKNSVQAEWDDHAAREDLQEGCSGLPSSIRWVDHICTDRAEAEKYIREHDKGFYDQLAVKFRAVKENLTSATKTRLEKQIADYEKKIVSYNEEHSLQKQKAAFISCPDCSSKLSRLHLRGNSCPVCGKKDIRAEYVLEQLKSFKEKISKWQKELASENAKLAAKNIKSSKVFWLVKIEYHT